MINKNLSLVAMLSCSFIVGNMQAAESNYQYISIASTEPFFRVYRQDIELTENLGFQEGKPFATLPFDANNNVYPVQTTFQPWDKSFYFIAGLRSGQWQKISERHSGQEFKNKSLWILNQNGTENIQ